MSNETIADLRSALFETLRGLADKEKPMDIDRARAVSDVAQTIINTAKIEVEHMKIAGGKGSGFIPSDPVPGTTLIEQRPGVRVTQHRLKG